MSFRSRARFPRHRRAVCEGLEGRLLLAGAPFTVSFQGTQLTDGDTTPSAADGTDFGQATAQADGFVTRKFIVSRLPGSTFNLTFLNKKVDDIGTSIGFTTVGQEAPGQADTESSIEVQVSMDRSPGSKSATIRLSGQNDDATTFDFSFKVAGYVTGPAAQDLGTIGSTPKTDDNSQVSIGGQFDGDGLKFSDSVNKAYRFKLTGAGSNNLDLNVNVASPDPLAVGDLRIVLARDTGGSGGAGDGVLSRSEFNSALLNQTRSPRTQDYTFSEDGLSAGDYILEMAALPSAATDPFGNGAIVEYDLELSAAAIQPANVSVTFNGVAVNDNDTTPSTSDGTIIGTAQVGQTPPKHTFTVRNTGGSQLELDNLQVTGSAFDIPSGLPDTLAPNATATFDVVLLTASNGDKTGVVSFETNVGGKNPFNFTVSGTVTNAPPPPAPEVSVSVQGGAALTSGQSGTVDFGTVAHGAAGATVTFVVKNDGNDTLTLQTQTLPNGFTLSEPLAGSLEPGESDTFTLTLSSDAPGTPGGSISIDTNDADENPFNIPITGTVNPPAGTQVPEISVAFDDDITGGGTITPLADGQAAILDFGAADQGQPGPGRMFIVANPGTAPLTVTLGPIPAGYELVDGLSGPIAPSSTETFILRLSATAPAGPQTGTISIASNDADESPFEVTISGIVNLVVQPPEPADIEVIDVIPGKLASSIIAGNARAKGVLSVVIRNDSGVLFNDVVALSVHASTDAALDTADGSPLFSTNKRVKLNVGAQKAIKLNVPLKDARAGTQTLLATATAAAGTSTRAGPTLIVAPPFVNLTGSDALNALAKPVAFGRKVSLSFLLQNSGNVPTTKAPVEYTLIVSNNGSETGEVFRKTVFGKASLKPSATKAQRLSVTFDAGSFAPGDYTLIVRLVSAELNQTNGRNVALMSFRIA